VVKRAFGGLSRPFRSNKKGRKRAFFDIFFFFFFFLCFLKVSESRLAALGLTPYGRVSTRKCGKATIVGICKDNKLWMQLDRDRNGDGTGSVSHFSCVQLTAESVRTNDILPITDAEDLSDDDDDDLRGSATLPDHGLPPQPVNKDLMCAVKLVSFGAKSISIVHQNRNGPCPLIALVNVLLLRGNLTLPLGTKEISLSHCATRVADYIHELSGCRTLQIGEGDQQIAIDDLLARMLKGMDVCFSFKTVADFQFTPAIALFTIADVGLVHGWIADPDDAALQGAFRASSSYIDDILAVLAVIDERKSAKVAPPPPPPSVDPAAAPAASPPSEPAAPAVPPTAPLVDAPAASPVTKAKLSVVLKDSKDHNDDDDDDDDDDGYGGTGKSRAKASDAPPVAKAAKDDVKVTLSESESAALTGFYSSTAQRQFTSFGMEALVRHLEEKSPAVLFYANHFFVVIKNEGKLYALVTDAGFADNLRIAWESLSALTAGTGSEFFDAHFRPYRDLPDEPLDSSDDEAAANEVVSMVVMHELAALRNNDLKALLDLYTDTAMCMLAVEFDTLLWRGYKGMSARAEIERRHALFVVERAELLVQRVEAPDAKGGTVTCEWDIFYRNRATGAVDRDWFRVVKFIAPVGENGAYKIVAMVRQALKAVH
jgi:hypothetical protein